MDVNRFKIEREPKIFHENENLKEILNLC